MPMHKTVLVLTAHLIFTMPCSGISDLGTGVVTISFSPHRKDSKAALSEEIFEWCALGTAQHPQALSISKL